MKVSVCIPTYNQAPYLSQAVRSAYEQTLVPVEIVVSDDCSTDETPAVLRLLAEEIPVLKVVRQPQNLGLTRNVDTCLRMATGEFIVKLDSDDYLAPSFIEKLAGALQEHPEAGYAHAAVQEIDKHGAFQRERRLARKSGFQSGQEALRAAIRGYRVAANIIMFRQSALEQVGYIAAQSNFAEDYYLSASLAAAGLGNYYQGEILSFYRVWTDANNVRPRRKLAEIVGLRKIFEEVLEPAFRQRGWDAEVLRRRRADFACEHADCLGWEVFTADEKTELADALNLLSATARAKRTAWLYRHGYGRWVGVVKKIKALPKTGLRKVYLRLQA